MIIPYPSTDTVTISGKFHNNAPTAATVTTITNEQTPPKGIV